VSRAALSPADREAEQTQHYWEGVEQYFDATLVRYEHRSVAHFVDKRGVAFCITGEAREALERFLDDNCAGG